MAWTLSDLDAIKAAIAIGARRVRYKDHEMEYRSLAEMIKAKNLIKAELDAQANGGRNRGGIKCYNPYMRKGL